MKKLLSIASYTFIENIRNRVFYVIVLFGVIVIGASLLLAALGGEQSRRILLDVGLSAIEFFALVTVGFSAVNLVLEEMDSKTIYLILTRPVSRAAYLAGRYAGLLAAVFCGMLAMAAVHVLVMELWGWDFVWRYPLAVALSAGKITVIGSVALFFSLFSSSAISSVSFTLFFWVLGHFSEEIRFLTTRVQGALSTAFLKTVYYLVPNMQYFNLRDFWDVPGISGSWLLLSGVYGVLYSLFYLGLSLLLLRRREF